MNRGAIVIVSIGGGLGKPRPALIVQTDDWMGTKTVLVAPFTSDIPGDMLLRPVFEPSSENGLRDRSALMVDKITPARWADIGDVAGRLSNDDMERVEVAMQMILGILRA